MMMVEHDTLVPNDLVKMGNQTLRLRYITRHSFQYRYHFQPGGEPLSPFVENDVVIISVNKDQGLKFEVIQQ